MNPSEELLTNVWSEFVLRARGYDILLRNVTIAGTEYDAIGVRCGGEAFVSSPRVENLETKHASPVGISRSRRKLREQVARRLAQQGFSSYIALSNEEECLTGLPEPVGRAVATVPAPGAFGGGRWLTPSGNIPSLPLIQRAYDPIRTAVRQVYGTAKAIGLPTIFAKCQRTSCPFFYGFEARIPLPDPAPGDTHSGFCPSSPTRSRAFVYHSKGFHVNGRTYQVVRRNVQV